MEYRSLGRTGVQVSIQCLGCMMFGGKTAEAESMDIIDRAIDREINFLDTGGCGLCQYPNLAERWKELCHGIEQLETPFLK